MAIAAGGAGFLLRREARDAYALVTEDMMVDTSRLFAEQLRLRLTPGRKLSDVAIAWGGEFDSFRASRFRIRILGFDKTRPGIDVYVVDANGTVVFSSRRQDPVGSDYSKWRDVRLTLQGEYGARASRIKTEGEEVVDYFVGSPITLDGKIVGAVSVIRTRTSLTNFLDLFMTRALIALAIALTLVIAFGGLMFLWITGPVERLRSYALRISKGEKPPMPELPNRELKQLGEAFEEMRVSVEGRKTIERFVQSLVHEMKSPLSAMRGSAELVLESSGGAKPMPVEQRDRFLKNIVEEAHRSENILEEILRLASVESKTTLENKTTVSLVEQIEQSEKALLPLATRREVRFQNRFENGKIQIIGDPFLVAQSIRNILQNAVEFSDQGGTVVVTVETTDSAVVVGVFDSGVGIPEFARGRVFEKFFSLERPATGRKGSGLGLCFVRDVVRLHGGDISVTPRADGKRGVHVELRFPL